MPPKVSKKRKVELDLQASTKQSNSPASQKSGIEISSKLSSIEKVAEKAVEAKKKTGEAKTRKAEETKKKNEEAKAKKKEETKKNAEEAKKKKKIEETRKKKQAESGATTRIVVKLANGYSNNWKGYSVEPNESDASVLEKFATIDEANDYILKYWKKQGLDGNSLEEYKTFKNDEGFLKVTIVDLEGAPSMIWADFERPKSRWVEVDEDGNPFPKRKKDGGKASKEDHDKEVERDDEEAESFDEKSDDGDKERFYCYF